MLTVLILNGCQTVTSQISSGDYTTTVVVNGTDAVSHDRTYKLHVPSGYSAATPWPLVLAFHGRGQTAAEMETMTGFTPIADREKFLLAYPQGYQNSWAIEGSTEADVALIDDVAFVDAMLTNIKNLVNVDVQKVYSTGASNGAAFSHLLGIRRAAIFAAIGPVACVLPAPYITETPSEPVAVVEFHGTADTTVPYNGGDVITGGDFIGTVVSAEATIQYWMEKDGMTYNPPTNPTREADIGTPIFPVYLHKGTGGAGGAEVDFYEIQNLGHYWPGYLGLGGIDASETIWTFFKAHPKL